MSLTVGNLLTWKTPPLRHDIFADDCRKLRLDTEKLLSEIIILDLTQALGPVLKMTWQPKILLVP